jgi:hypothetical protein
MFQNFLMKRMLKSQGVPKDQVESVMKIVNKNPELFKKIAEETQVLISQGKDQMSATMEVMAKYKDELQKLNEK